MSKNGGHGLLLTSTPLQGDALPGGVCPSLSNLTLASYVQSKGEAVAVLDPSVDLGPVRGDDILDRTAAEVARRRPRVLGAACLSPTEGRFGVALAQRMAAVAPDVPVVLGGTWANPWAEEILRRFDAVDGVVVGAGEQAARILAADGLADPASIPGLVWRDGPVVRANDPVEDLAVPAPCDLSLMAHPERYDIFCWSASRGCPFRCRFCTEHLSTPGYHLDPLDKVEADVEALRAVGHPWYLWVCDPLFGANRRYTARVAQLLGRTGMPFLVESRVDVLHPDDVGPLADAGCNLVYFGLEAVAHRSLEELDKIGSQPERHRRYLDRCRALVEACLVADVLPVMGVLAPVPGDSPAELEETLTFLGELAAIPGPGGVTPASEGLAPCFHAFPVRFDRGAEYDGHEARLRAMGVTFDDPPDPMFGDRTLRDASPTVSAADAARFRDAVRALNPPSDVTRTRLLRSFPRPYVEFTP